MSLLPERDYVKALDPRLDLSQTTKILLEEGGSSVTLQRYTANSVSPSAVSFSQANPPNAATVIDRNMMIRMPVRLKFTATNVPAGQFLFQCDGRSISGLPYTGGLVGGVDAPRAFPVNQITSNLQLNLNSQSFSQQVNQYIEPLLRYDNSRVMGRTNYSLTPTMQDTYQAYDDFTTYGSGKNVLANYGENDGRDPRGGFSGIQVVSQYLVGSADGTPSAGLGSVMIAEVDCEFTENIFVSPLGWGKMDKRGLYGISTMSIVLNIDSNYKNLIWSHDQVSSGKVIQDIELGYGVTTPGFANLPELHVTYITPQFGTPMPMENLYEYNNIAAYLNTQQGSVPPQGIQTVNVNVVQLDSVPSHIFIFAKKRVQDKTYNDPDCYARIRGITMTFGNVSGILSDATEQQLYKISCNNGSKQSWNEWSKYVGSVLCVSFARDISMGMENVVGALGQYQVQYKLNIQNLSRQAITYDVNTIVVYDGFVRVEGRSVYLQNNLGPIKSVYNSPTVRNVEWAGMDQFTGAGFKSFLKSAGKKGLSLATKEAKKYGPDLIQMALSEIPGVGPALGLAAKEASKALSGGSLSPEEYEMIISKLITKAKKGKKTMSSIEEMTDAVVPYGGGVIGGKRMTPAQMKKMLAKSRR